MAGRPAVVTAARLEHEHRIGLSVAAEAGEVGKGAVRTEDVVGVVAAHLEPARRHDEPLAGEGRADRLTALGRPVGRVGVGEGGCVGR